MTQAETDKLFRRASAKAVKFNAPVVVRLAAKYNYCTIQLLRGYSPARQDDIMAGRPTEIIVRP